MITALVSLSLGLAPLVCPPGTTLRSQVPLAPNDHRGTLESFCQGPDELHGPVRMVVDGRVFISGQYDHGLRAGAWVWRNASGKRLSVLEFDERGRLLQLTSNPDAERPRVEVFEGRLVTWVNGIRMTARGDQPRERFMNHVAVLRLIEFESPERPRVVGEAPSPSSIWSVRFRIVGGNTEGIACATFEQGGGIQKEALFVGALRPAETATCRWFVDLVGDAPVSSVEQGLESLAYLRQSAREAVPVTREPDTRPRWTGF